jgi:hypothetical protein
MKILVQKRNFTVNQFEIRDNGLFVSLKSFSEKFEETYTYEDISSRITRTIKKETGWLFLSSVFGLVSIFSLADGSLAGFLICVAISMMFLVIMKLTIKEIVNLYVHGDRILPVYANKPDKETVDEFIETLKTTKRNYLISKYGKIDKDLPAEGQLNNLIWLKNADYLSEEEFISLKDSLLGKSNGSNIGFNK